MKDVFFKNKRVNISKLLSYGFIAYDDCYVYCVDIAQGQLSMKVTVADSGEVRTEVTDNDTQDKYVLHLARGATGAFVGAVRSDYEAVLEDIAEKCFETEIFKEKQTESLITYVREKYGDELEFLWQKFPDNAVWRRKDNGKWYAAVLTVKAEKLVVNGEGMLEIVDLRVKPEDVDTTVDGKRYYPGYHMNKRHWYTVILDGSVSFEELCERLDESYLLAKVK